MSRYGTKYPSHPKTINLTACTGLTFLYGTYRYRGFPLAIYGHTKASPGLLENPPADVRAIYVPLPPGEEILSMSTRIGEDTEISLMVSRRIYFEATKFLTAR